MKTVSSLLVASVALTLWQVACARSGALQVSSEISEFGRIFKLAAQSKKGNQQLYEYTAGNETVDNWHSLVSIVYVKGLKSNPLQWGLAFKASVANDTPNYSVWADRIHGYAKVIYEPNARFPDYEVDVFKSYHIPACDGTISIQYAIRSDGTLKDGLGADVKHARLVQLAAEAKRLSDGLVASTWSPDCGQ